MEKARTNNIPQFSLPVYIQEKYPEALVGGYSPHRQAYRMLCTWRGEKKPSGSLRLKNGVWLWYDHGAREGGNPVDFLVRIDGYSEQEAVSTVYGKHATPGGGKRPMHGTALAGKRRTIEMNKNTALPELKQSTLQILEKGRQALLENGLPQSWKRRGLNLNDGVMYGLGRDGEDTLIPLYDVTAEKLVHVKRRIHQPSEGQSRFIYLETGRGSPCWFSPNWSFPGIRGVVVVEGEGKAMSVDNALAYYRKHKEADSYYSLLGVPGASAALPVEEIRNLGKPVFIIPDRGESGAKAVFGNGDKPGWEGLLREAGVEVHVLPAMADLCDIAHSFCETYGHDEGNALFGEALVKLFHSAVQGQPLRLQAHRISQHGALSAKIVQHYGQKAHGMSLFIQGLLKILSKGQFVVANCLNNPEELPEELRGCPVIALSQTETAELIGSRYRRQGHRTRIYAKQDQLIIPIPKAQFPIVLSKNGTTVNNIYLVNINSLFNSLFNYSATTKIITEDNLFYAVRDAARKNRFIANPLGVRGQLLLRQVIRLKQTTVAELTKFLGCHGNTTRRLLSRLQRWGLVTVADNNTVELAEAWFGGFTEYLKLVKSNLKQAIKDLWLSVAWPWEGKKEWRLRSRQTPRYQA